MKKRRKPKTRRSRAQKFDEALSSRPFYENLVRIRLSDSRVTAEAIDVLLRGYHPSVGRLLSGEWGRDLLKLARQSFSDSGRSAADLDEELVAIDTMLECAGYEAERGTVPALRDLIRRVHVAERALAEAPRRRVRRA